MLFNGSKSKLLFFKRRFSNGMESGIMVNRETVNISDDAVQVFSHYVLIGESL